MLEKVGIPGTFKQVIKTTGYKLAASPNWLLRDRSLLPLDKQSKAGGGSGIS